MHSSFRARLRAAVFCGFLLLLTLPVFALPVFALPVFALPVFAFDEDHKEVINGAMLHFRARGADKKNPCLVILHGGPEFSSQMFYAWGPSLEKSLNVVYLDQRGCGESARLSVANIMNPKPAEIKGYTFPTLVADIEGVRQFLKVDKWYVLGHSYGGMLGLEYVAAHPEPVLGYIHMDGLVSVPQMQNAILDNAAKKFAAETQKGAADLASAYQLRALPPDNPARLFGAFGLAMGPAGLYFAGDQKTQFPLFRQQIAAAVQPYHIPLAAQLPANEPAVALLVNEHFLTRDDTPLLAKIAVPTLIIVGKEDGVVTPQSVDAAHAAIKNSNLVELDNCGHFPFFEQPDKTTAAIIGFVSSHAESSPKVIVDFTIDEKGRPTQMRIVQASENGAFDEACLNAVRKTRFQPAIKNGVPLSVNGEHTFTIAP